MRSVCENSLDAVRGGILVIKKSGDRYYEVIVNTERDFNCAIEYLRATRVNDVVDLVTQEYNDKGKSNFWLLAENFWNFRNFCRGKCTFMIRN